MPGWHDRTIEAQKAGKLQLVGLIQEQHPDRCALFMQWKRMGWPILVDALNRTGIWSVPIVWAIDEHGILRSTRPRTDWVLGEFLETKYPKPTREADVETLGEPEKLFLDGKNSAAIAAYRTKVEADPSDAASWFRLGCSYRRRHDSKQREPHDFQNAIDAWTKARNLKPRNYIFQRRIQQYGPRLEKPYPFYDWVVQARKDIAARGETPHPLRAEPEGSEFAQRIRSFEAASTDVEAPDPRGELERDRGNLVAFSSVVAPRPVHAGDSARVYLAFRPAKRATWDNEAGPLRAWVDVPEGWGQSARLLEAPRPRGVPSSDESRSVELEIKVPATLKPGKQSVSGYAVYFVCDGPTGACQLLRRDFTVEFDVGPVRKRRARRRR